MSDVELKDGTIIEEVEPAPVGPLKFVPMNGCEEMGKRIDDYLVQWRKESALAHKKESAFAGYVKDSFITDFKISRFGTGEAKGSINDSIRGDDIYILVDVCNYNVTYSLFGQVNHMSPDDHFADVKRVIAAAAGKARRINVIMPFLYEGRQHRRKGRESLDCALMLQELVDMGVDNIITFDAHDPRVQNAIPLKGFETVQPIYQFLKALCKSTPDLSITPDDLIVVSPDEGGMERAIYFANMLGVDVAMFYKRRDFSRVVDGRNPIVAHEYLGRDIEGKDVLVVDDMISSGDSMLDVSKELKARKARRVFICSTFGLFTNGMSKFDEYYEKGIIDKVLTTNLVYQKPELLKRPYYVNVDISKYIAYIIDTLNHDASLSDLLVPTERIHRLLKKYKEDQAAAAALKAAEEAEENKEENKAE